MLHSKNPNLDKLPGYNDFVGEVIEPISFPIRYVLKLNAQSELNIFCYLQNFNFAFAMWTKHGGLSALSFEPLNSLRTNGCLTAISEFCEQVYDAWSAGNADSDDCGGSSAPANGGTDEATS